MKLPESLFSRMLLAYLPFAVTPFDLFKTGVAAAWIVLFLWGTVAFFWFTRRFFPGRTLRHAFFLWLLVWAQAMWTLTRLPPVWVVSVFFLMPVSFLDDTVKARRVRLFSKEVPRSQYSSISASGNWGRRRHLVCKENPGLGRYFFERGLAGIGFAGFVLSMTFIRELCENRLGIRAFDQPAGFLLTAAVFAFVWKNQPYGQGK